MDGEHENTGTGTRELQDQLSDLQYRFKMVVPAELHASLRRRAARCCLEADPNQQLRAYPGGYCGTKSGLVCEMFLRVRPAKGTCRPNSGRVCAGNKASADYKGQAPLWPSDTHSWACRKPHSVARRKASVPRRQAPAEPRVRSLQSAATRTSANTIPGRHRHNAR